MKKKIIYGLLFAVAMVTASSSFVSCKDYEGDDYAGLRDKLIASEVNSQTTIDELIRLQQAQIQYQIDNLVAALDKMDDPTAAKKISDDAQAELDKWMAKYKNATTLEEKLAILSELNKILRQVTGTSDEASAIHVPSAVETIINLWGDSLTAAYDTAFIAYYLAVDDSIRLDALKDRADSLFNRANFLADSALQVATNYIINNLLAKMDSTHKADIKNLDSLMKAGDKKLADDIAKLDSAYKAGDSLLTVRCNDIEAGYKKADSVLQAQIDSLCGEVTALKQDIDNILGTLKKQISGVIIQGTYSPVFGYGSLPLGIQTNILAAYAGKAVITSQFPSDVKTHYASGKSVLSKADFDFANSLNAFTQETITEGDLLMNEEKGNAGKMYLTVNPTNIDFSGTDFKLVNSKGQESRIELDSLSASDEVLTFGWTRGTGIKKESENGFYEVSATISKDNALKMQPRFDKAGFKKAVQTATEGSKRMAVKEAAKALFNSLQPVDRFGVKAEWQDTLGTRSVTSAYDIAAMSIEPLGFGFKLPNGLISLPTINKKVIADSLHININIDPIVITEQDKATGKYVIKVEVDAKDLDLSLINDATKYAGYHTTYKVYDDNTSTWKDVDVVDVKKLLNDIQKDTKIKAFIDVTPQFEEMFGQFNATFTKLNNAMGGINKQIDNIAASVNSYIDRANGWISRIQNLFNRVGDLVQPVLLWSDGANAGELGGFVSANYAVGTAVKAGSDLALIPTSYSLELFAPAYKKSLLVTNAYKDGKSAQDGDATLKAAAQALSNQLKDYAVYQGNSVRDGMVVNVGNTAGITYEIAYTAVDYEGKVAGRKFYLTVVE